MNPIAETHSLFEIDTELDALLEEIQEHIELKGDAPEKLTERLQQFCEAHGEKVDRLGRFLRMMEAREQYCRTESARLADRARKAASKIDRTKSIILFYLLSRELRQVDGREFTLRVQKNSQDSVRIVDEMAVPIGYCTVQLKLDGVLWETALSYFPEQFAKTLYSAVQEKRPNTDLIKDAFRRNEHVSGAEVHRGFHLRLA